MPHRFVQPALCGLLQRQEAAVRLFPVYAAPQAAGVRKILHRRPVPRLPPADSARHWRGLHGEGSADAHAFYGHVLVARKKQVKVKLARDPARKVFSAAGQHRARVQILFKAAVIDTHAYVTYRAQTGTGSTRGVKSLGDAQLFQILGLLPDVYIIGDNACDADAQAVFQRVDSLRKQKAARRPDLVHWRTGTRRPWRTDMRAARHSRS